VAQRIRPDLFARMRAAAAAATAAGAATQDTYSPAILSQLYQVDLALQYEAPAVSRLTLEHTAAAAGLSADGEEPSYLEMLWLAGNLRAAAAKHWHRSKFRNTRQVRESSRVEHPFVYERRQKISTHHSCAPSFGLPACKRPD